MATQTRIWWILGAFFLLMSVVYTFWSISFHSSLPWQQAVEWTGSVGLLFAAFMAALIAFYVGRVHHAQGGELPEDRLGAEIDDGDPEMGEFSPWSWWPIVLATAAAFAILGLAVGTWMFPIGLAIFAVAIIGWVYEYYRGYFAR